MCVHPVSAAPARFRAHGDLGESEVFDLPGSKTKRVMETLDEPPLELVAHLNQEVISSNPLEASLELHGLRTPRTSSTTRAAEKFNNHKFHTATARLNGITVNYSHRTQRAEPEELILWL